MVRAQIKVLAKSGRAWTSDPFNTVSPGVTSTPIFGRLGLSPSELDAAAAGLLKMVPIGRFATVEDIAAGVAYLGSTDAAYLVGSELTIDGGLGQLRWCKPAAYGATSNDRFVLLADAQWSQDHAFSRRSGCGLPADQGRYAHGEQFKPEFLAIGPNNRMPAIIDQSPADAGAPISVFESGAILLYLAEKTGRLIPSAVRERNAALEWLFWQVGGLGPMAGQNHHFSRYASEKIPYAIERYIKETNRLYGVLDRRLATQRYLAGSEYSIADIAPTRGSCPGSCRDRIWGSSLHSLGGSTG